MQPANIQNSATLLALKAMQEKGTVREPSWSEQLGRFGTANSSTPNMATGGMVGSSYTLCSATPSSRAYNASDLT